ncbi:unnamed protein product [Calicophoron daubneyi]|uniref:RING-CH-type domain-containing protein n=1 Tax=Calicophoron daubneyi TaxID=300641 RepID=A0AAV2U099_CALDB
MQTSISLSIPGSPFQSSSHQTNSNPLDVSLPRENALRTALKKLRNNDRDQLGSPSDHILHSNHHHMMAPYAPKPSLEMNEDNVLFTHSIYLARRRSSWVRGRRRISSKQSNQMNHRKSETTLNDSEMMNRDSSLSGLPKTSTPFIGRSKRRQTSQDVINSALIGAPRLALSLSLQASNGETGPEGVINASDFLQSFTMDDSTSSGETSPANVSSRSLKCSPPIVAINVSPVEKAFRNTCTNSRGSEVSCNQFRCRICLEGDDLEDTLLSPCRCKGTVGLVHKQCLQRWLLESGKVNCELCGYAYILAPSKHKSLLIPPTRVADRFDIIREWLHSTATRRHLLADVICLILLTPCTYCGVYFCAISARSYAGAKTRSWEVFGLWVLAGLLIVLLNAWTFLAFRHHWASYQRYRLYRQQMEREEAERLAALPRWRFSVQPRPRGSSILYRSTPDPDAVTDAGSILPSDSARRTFGTEPNASNLAELCLPSPLSEGTARAVTNMVTPRMMVSLALSAVPEVTEESSNPNTIERCSSKVT